MTSREIQLCIDIAQTNGKIITPEAVHHIALFEIALQLAIMNEREENKMHLQCPSRHGDQQCEKLAGHSGPHQEGGEVWDHA
jgi:hypothetical protein